MSLLASDAALVTRLSQIERVCDWFALLCASQTVYDWRRTTQMASFIFAIDLLWETHTLE